MEKIDLNFKKTLLIMGIYEFNEFIEASKFIKENYVGENKLFAAIDNTCKQFNLVINEWITDQQLDAFKKEFHKFIKCYKTSQEWKKREKQAKNRFSKKEVKNV